VLWMLFLKNLNGGIEMSKVLVRSTKARATYVGEVEIIFDENGLAWVEEELANQLFSRSGGGYMDAKKGIGSDLSGLNPLELLSVAYQQILQDPDKSMLIKLRGMIRNMAAEVDTAVDQYQRSVGSGNIPGAQAPGMEQQMGQAPQSIPSMQPVPQMSPMIDEPVNPDDIGLPPDDEEPMVEPQPTERTKSISKKHSKSKNKLKRLKKGRKKKKV